MLLIGAIGLIVLGPEKLPAVTQWIGRHLATWRRFAHQTRSEIEQELKWEEIKQFGHDIKDSYTQSINDFHTSVNSTLHAAPANSVPPASDTLTFDSQVTPTMNIESTASQPPLIGVVMGSTSDWKYMKHAARILKEFGIPFEAKVVSAHRMPDTMFMYAATARDRGLKAIIAGAGGAAHLPGMLAAKTTLPVLGVPIPATLLNGQDALYSIVQMPKGIPVATFAIGEPGAANAALFAVSLLANDRPELVERLDAFRIQQTGTVSQAVLDVEDLE